LFCVSYILQVTREARESVLAAMFQHDIPPPFVAQKGLAISRKMSWLTSLNLSSLNTIQFIFQIASVKAF